MPTQISQLEYYDPVRKELTTCVPARRLCTVQSWCLPESAIQTCKPAEQAGLSVSCDALGESTIGNLQTQGSREIITVTGGPLGLKEPEPTIKEFWFSPRLDLNLVVKRFEPRGGAQNFHVVDIDLNEPDTRLFVPPEGFRTARTVIQ